MHGLPLNLTTLREDLFEAVRNGRKRVEYRYRVRPDAVLEAVQPGEGLVLRKLFDRAACLTRVTRWTSTPTFRRNRDERASMDATLRYAIEFELCDPDIALAGAVVGAEWTRVDPSGANRWEMSRRMMGGNGPALTIRLPW